MNQIIYLARHGEAGHNVGEDHFSLTPRGRGQAVNLASRCDSKGLIFMTSELERSIETARIVSEHNGVDLIEGINWKISPDLNETQTKQQEIKDRGYAKGCSGYIEVIRDPSFPFESNLGRRVYGSIYNFSESSPDKDILVVGHVGINEAFLKHIGSKVCVMDNCDLLKIEKYNSRLRVP